MNKFELEWVREQVKEKKSADWHWILGILACAGIVVAFLLGNLLFASIIGLSAVVMLLLAHAPARDTEVRLTHRDILINDRTYQLREIEAYHIDEKNGEYVLRFLTGHFFLPLVIVYIPHEHVDDINAIFGSTVPADHIEEDLSHRLLEIFGF